MNHATVPAVEVEIKNATYAVEVIPAGECGLAAVRVIKLVNGESYDVIRTKDNVVECSCPDFVCRHEGKGTVCKHGAAMLARGFLDAPKPVARKPVEAPAPITAADVARAKMFGIKLPSIPVAPVFIVPEIAPAPEGWGEVGGGGSVEDEANPRDSWPSWTDADRWELGLEPAEEAEAKAEARVSDEWMAETVALHLTGLAVEAIEEGRGDDVDALWIDLEEEHKATFRGFLEMIGSTATGWSSWIQLCTLGSPVSFKAPAPAPVKRTQRFVPLPEDEAEVLGFELGYGGVEAAAPAEWDSRRRAAFDRGFADGERQLRWECQEFEAWCAEVDAAHQDRYGIEQPYEMTGTPSYEVAV